MKFKVGDEVICTCGAKDCPKDLVIVDLPDNKTYANLLGRDAHSLIKGEFQIGINSLRLVTKLDKVLK